jgi:hypothetical protein
MLRIRLLACITLAMIAGSQATLPVARQADAETREQIAFTRDAGDATEKVEFGRRAPEVGDQIEQAVSIEMRLSTSLRRGNDFVEKSSMTMRNEQNRVLTVTDVAAGRTVAMLVRYSKATKQSHDVSENDQPKENAPLHPAPRADPVQGKAYRCRREPGDDGRLIITDAEDNIPPMSEYEIVARNMETLGRPNPFVDFLAGRCVRVGETIVLPRDVAERLFGMADDFGNVLRFELTFESVQMESGVRCAKFRALVDAASNDSSQMRLQVEGPLVVEIDTCRAVRTHLAGPIATSETRGSHSTSYQLIGTGKLAMTIASTYRDVAR